MCAYLNPWAAAAGRAMILADAGNRIKKPQLIFNVLRQSISKNILEKEWPRNRSCLDFESRHRRRMDENRKIFIHCGRAGAFWRAASCFKGNRRFRPRVSKRFFQLFKPQPVFAVLRLGKRYDRESGAFIRPDGVLPAQTHPPATALFQRREHF